VKLKPIFSSLAGMVHGVHFAIANVSADNMRLKEMSEASTTPIRYVPFIGIYTNGKFYTEYRGTKTQESIAKAIHEISTKIQTGANFSNGKVCTSPDGLNAYCTEETDDTDDVCYLTFDEAYGNQPCSNKGKGSMCTYQEAYGTAKVV
jgi:hypothetical protein